MKIPFNVLDFLDRAEHVYGDRIGLVDEPDQPASSWGELTWREVAERRPGMAAGLDALGVGFGERVAIVSQNSRPPLDRPVRRVGLRARRRPINFRLDAEEVGYIVEHSGATVLLIDPELDERWPASTPAPLRARAKRPTRCSMRFDLDPSVGAERGRHRVDQLHERHDGPARRVCSSPTATSG